MTDMKKALIVTTVSGFVPQFEMNDVKILKELGYEVHYASNYTNPSYGNDNTRLEGTGIICHQIDFVRSPYKPGNIKAYKQLKGLLKSTHFDLIHCHTPMGAAITRLAAHRTHTKPVLYTAHGFHFYKGAPIINWLIYYPMEYLLSYWTDEQICMNHEDYEISKNKMHAGHTSYIPGVGIDNRRYADMLCSEQIKEAKRTALGIPKDAIVLLSVGELIKRKNHSTILKAIAKIDNPQVVYLICGQGREKEHLQDMAKHLGIENQVIFAGYRTDVRDMHMISDIFVFPSYQEGLPMALLEAMADGMPIVCSDIRGNRDLVSPKEGIKVCPANNVDKYIEAITGLLSNKAEMHAIGALAKKRALDFDSEKVASIMQKVYASY